MSMNNATVPILLDFLAFVLKLEIMKLYKDSLATIVWLCLGH